MFQFCAQKIDILPEHSETKNISVALVFVATIELFLRKKCTKRRVPQKMTIFSFSEKCVRELNDETMGYLPYVFIENFLKDQKDQKVSKF